MRIRTSFDEGWIFHQGELERPPARLTFKSGGCGSVSDCVGHERGAMRIPEGREILGHLLPAFSHDGSSGRSLGEDWIPVRIPHDWRIRQGYRSETRPDDYPWEWQGFLPTDVGYYRKTFSVPEDWNTSRIYLEFEGVMRSSSTWVNGHFLGDHASGYTGFFHDIADVLRYGPDQDNVVLVRCDVSESEGWWGEGAGLYRHVWLTRCSQVHFIPNGVWARTDGVSAEQATLVVEATVTNESAEDTDVRLHFGLRDALGDSVSDTTADATCPSGQTITTVVRMNLSSPHLWNVADPYLYTLAADLEVDGRVLDALHIMVGLRRVDFTADDGLHLNGRRVQVWGANIHQDFAGLGIGLSDRIIDYKLELLRDMGCTAIRTAHHPPAPRLLDTCDRSGMLVICENRHLSSSRDRLNDLESMIMAARNHPSVIAWSLENEEFLEGTPTGTRILKSLVRRVHSLDPTRPTTVGGVNLLDDASYYDCVDVVGYNYASTNGTLSRHRETYPRRPLLATEDGLHPTTRGAYADAPDRGHLSEYGTTVPPFDVERAGPEWVWQYFADNPHIAGAFVWSGFDYRGEPFPLGWPCIGAHFGAMDSCGFPKGYYWLLRSFFKTEPVVHILPHWTWPGREGQAIKVVAYSNCAEVELMLNGESLGRKLVQCHRVEWTAAYQPGTLVARAFRAKEPVASAIAETAGEPYGIHLNVDRARISIDPRDVAIVEANIVDKHGRLVPDASHEVEFTTGNGIVLGVGNGDPADHDPDVAPRRRAFHGRCLAIIGSQGDGRTINVEARSAGLSNGRLSIERAEPSSRSGRSHD